jgi:pimeloyl-ACP methyl ester carboxylesterase
MNKILFLLFFLTFFVSARESDLRGEAKKLFEKSKSMQPMMRSFDFPHEVVPTSDQKSFYAIFKPEGPPPKYWIVCLHGSVSFAFGDLAAWLNKVWGHDTGIIALQWWIGPNDQWEDYYTPKEIYREISKILEKEKVKPQSVMLVGFSRGSATTYPVVAMDNQNKKYFLLNIASSGSVEPETERIKSIPKGALKNTKWLTVAGKLDFDPNQGGIPAMRKTASWLKDQGAVVIESIEDQTSGHGALLRNEKNAYHVLEKFWKMK